MFLDLMALGEAVAERHRAGEIDRDTALVELTLLFADTVITNEGIHGFLDKRIGGDR